MTPKARNANQQCLSLCAFARLLLPTMRMQYKHRHATLVTKPKYPADYCIRHL